MPVIWESPVPIDFALAEALSLYLINKAGGYGERSLEKPVQEFTEEDAKEDVVVVWWILVKRDFEHALELEEQGESPLWVPSAMHFGDKMIERIKRYEREEYAADEMVAARAELLDLVGFTAYGYHKFELRENQ